MDGMAVLIAIMFVFAFVAGIIMLVEYTRTGDREMLEGGIFMTAIGVIAVLPMAFMMICVIITWLQERREK